MSNSEGGAWQSAFKQTLQMIWMHSKVWEALVLTVIDVTFHYFFSWIGGQPYNTYGYQYNF